jgi:integrase
MQTLTDMLNAIRAADLSERRKQDILAGLNSAARALGKPPDRILAEPSRLMAQLGQVSPRPLGISPRRWANILSLVRAALAQTHAISAGRSIQRLSERWDVLYHQLDRWQKLKLSRFLRFCSARGIEPAMVTEATFAAYRAYLDDAVLWNPDKIYAAVIDGWGTAQAAVADWPRVEITRADRRHRWTLEWESFPPSRRADWDAWCDRLSNPFEEVPLRPVKSTTIASQEWKVRGFASAVALSGQDPATITSLRDLVDIETYKKGLRYLLERGGGQPTQAVYDFAVTLKSLARQHLQVDKAHLDRMATVIRRLEADIDRPGLTEKNRTRLRQLDDPRQVRALIRLPFELIQIAIRNPKLHAGALEAQTAVAIALLLVAPMRLGNLAHLDLERNFVGLGRDQQVLIVIERESVKNCEPLEYPLPTVIVDLIDNYLREFRPRLAPADCTAFFPGRPDGSKSLNAVREQICTAIRRYTGMQINPHLFRQLGAKLYLEEYPGRYEDVRRFLAHRSMTTTTKFYTGLETAAAVRRYDAVILKLLGSAEDDDEDPSS